MRVLSLGAGVQSTTVLLLSLDGTIPAYDRVVFADTQDEPASVYDHLARLRELTPVDVVTAGRLSDTLDATFVPIPLFYGDGMGRRQCTYQYKLRPIRTHLRTLGADDVDLSLGISVDELERAKDSGLRWCRNVFPLLDLGWTRADCQRYLADRWPHPVARSACVYCPLRSDAAWRDMREHQPDDWARAVAFDRKARTRDRYVHRSRIPLEDVQLSLEDAGQLALDCEGMCGT